MKLSTIIRVSWFLPFAWIDGIRVRNKSFDIRYKQLQKWSYRVIHALGLTLKVEGVDLLPQDEPFLLVSNHQGTLDPLILVAGCPLPMSFVSKTSNGKLPILGRWMKNIDVILFDRDRRESNIHMLREATRYLKDGRSLLIFPEGTRAMGPQMNEFKVGATQPAHLAKVKIVPVTLNNAYVLDVKHPTSKQLTLTFQAPIEVEQQQTMTQAELAIYLHDCIKANIKG